MKTSTKMDVYNDNEWYIHMSKYIYILYMTASQNVKPRSIPWTHRPIHTPDPYQNAGDPDRSIRLDHRRPIHTQILTQPHIYIYTYIYIYIHTCKMKIEHVQRVSWVNPEWYPVSSVCHSESLSRETTLCELLLLHLVGGLVAMNFVFPYIYWVSIIIPIDELIFFRGVAQPPTRHVTTCDVPLILWTVLKNKFHIFPCQC